CAGSRARSRRARPPRETTDRFPRRTRRWSPTRSQRPLMNVGVGAADETLEQGMGVVGFAAGLGMKLAGDEERVVWQLDYFDQVAVGRGAAEDEICFFE